MNYYPFHLGDYAGATRHLSMLEHGAYRLLIDLYYLREGPLPADLAAVQRLACARTPEERAAVETVLAEFFTLTPDGWRNKRCDAEIERYQERSEKARESAGKRWQPVATATAKATAPAPAEPTAPTEECGGNADAMRTHSEGIANQEPRTNSQENTSPVPQRVAPLTRSRGSRLPPEWRPKPETLAWAVRERPDLDVGRTLEAFSDFWHARAGPGSTKLDWDLTFKTWVRKERHGHGGAVRDAGGSAGPRRFDVNASARAAEARAVAALGVEATEPHDGDLRPPIHLVVSR